MAAPKNSASAKKNLSQQLLAGLAVAGQVAMTSPMNPVKPEQTLTEVLDKKEANLALDISQGEHQEIMAKLVAYVNAPAGHLEGESEIYLEEQLSEVLGFAVRNQLEGQQLNHSIGIMGAEQHLKRFPGDTLADHDAYPEAGLAANRGAFGWFAQDGQLTPEAIMAEKYYFAVQLMYLSDWQNNYQQLKPWYKFRKMIVINPSEQVAVVGVVADAGPALWVQKQFGGSPEVIREGRIWSPKSRGKVLLLFVDDPENKVPLGPVGLDFQATLARQSQHQQLAADLLQLAS